MRQGYLVIGTSTSCASTIKEAAPELLGLHTTDTRLIAEHSYDIFKILRLLHERGELRTDFGALERRLPYHALCWLHAQRTGQPALDILRLIPDLKIAESEVDCCGIAGTYGLKREKYASVMALARRCSISYKRAVVTQHRIKMMPDACRDGMFVLSA